MSSSLDINIVVPPFSGEKFSGGVWCILQHAQELGRRGHRVNVVPTHPCSRPDWFPRPWRFNVVGNSPRSAIRTGIAALAHASVAAANFALRPGSPAAGRQVLAVRRGVGLMGVALSNYGTHGVRQGGAIDHLRAVLPPADLTVATDAETAWPVRLLGQGRLAYFAQHYEPYFWKERLGGEASRRESEMSYKLGLHQLANSPWLQGVLQNASPGIQVRLCPNAIDHSVFHGRPLARGANEPLRIISYGGRDAEWKGFRQMCEALRILKTKLPGLDFTWSVYGSALLPPDNEIFPYVPLGFLAPHALADAYRRHHVLLSASWYESFPLFPLEAMACGLAAITTQAGTELFARGGETAIVVPPRDPAGIADALAQLAVDEDMRLRLCGHGLQCSQHFTWQRAGDAMEFALVSLCALPAA